MTEPKSTTRPHHKPTAERLLETALFRSRWLMAPFYVGLVVALAALVVVFFNEAVHEFSGIFTKSPEQAILMVLFSGYENFVSKIDTGDDEDRPGWMGTVDFSGLKMKLIASIVAISAISLLRTFLVIGDGPMDQAVLLW